MKKYVNFVYKYSKQLFVLFLLLNVIALIGVVQIKLNSDFTIFMPKESEHMITLEEMEESFDSKSQLMIMVSVDSIGEDTTDELIELNNYMIGKFSHVIAPDFETDFVTKGLAMKQIVFDGDYHIMLVGFVQDDFGRKDLNQLKDYLDNSNFEYAISGDAYSDYEVINFIVKILLLFPPFAFGLVLLVFYSQMRSFKATILSVLPAGIGTLWTMGIIGWLGTEVSLLTVLAPIFTIVIGSADGLHFMSHIIDSEKEGLSRLEAIRHTLKMVGIPMIVTTITSMFGFIALIAFDSTAITELALSASLGILMAGIATWYVLPLILSKGIVVSQSARKQISYRFLKKLWGYPSVIILTIVLIVSGIFIPRIENEFNMLSLYKDNTEIKKNFDKINDINGGSIPVYGLVRSDDILSDDVAIEVGMLSEKLLKLESVSRVTNGYQIISLYSMMTGSAEMSIEDIYDELLDSGEYPLDEFINVEEGVARLMIVPTNLNNDTLDEIEEVVSEYGNVTGVQYVMKDLNDVIISKQVISILLASLAILIMLFISLRNIKLSIISLIPILSTVVAIFGFLAISNISLNVITATMFSIAIGVGIDYAVHFSSVFNVISHHDDVDVALDKAFNYCSRPIVANAFGLAIGLSVLMFSPLKIHLYLSLLMWVGMVLSVLLSLSLLPTMIRKTIGGKDGRVKK